MADYAPIYLYADQITATTSAAVTGGQLLHVSGDGTVAPAPADSHAFVGTAAQDAASGARVSYCPRGKVHESTTDGAVTAGNNVFTTAAGTVDETGTAVNRIGVFLTSAGAGELARWMEF